jgi:DNA-directed RNA polymerase specialized sigma24 family protein
MDGTTSGCDAVAPMSRASENAAMIDRLLVPLAYEALRAFARRVVARDYRGKLNVTGTDIVHEAVLRLICRSRLNLRDANHLMAVLKHGIRHFLIDQHRWRTALKRAHRESSLEANIVADGHCLPPIEFSAVMDAIAGLASRHPRAAQVIELHVFHELTLDQTAD